MKIKLLLILSGFILGLFLFIGTSLATSGCCSWHGGVSGCSNGRQVCNDGTYSPSCTCSGGYDNDEESYLKYCTYKGERMTTTGTYIAVLDDLRIVLTNVYQRDLERAITTDDVTYWADKLSIDSRDCQQEKYSEQIIHDDIIKGEEYKKLQLLKAYKTEIRSTFVSILGRPAIEEEVDYIAKNESDINVVKEKLKMTDEWQKKNNWLGFYASKYKWWLIGIAGLLIYFGIAYYSENKKPK